MAGFSNPNVATPDVIAGNYATANLQNQQANLLVPAQAALANAQTGLVGAQTVGADIGNKVANIDLNSRLATMTAFRQAYSEANGVPTQPNTAGAPTPTGQTSVGTAGSAGSAGTASASSPATPSGVPVGTPVTSVTSPDAPARADVTKAIGGNVDQTSPTAVDAHAASVPFTANGSPNTMSDGFLTRVRDLSIANGADPVQANAAYVAGVNARLDMSKKFAEVTKSVADGQISQEAAAQQHLDTINDLAHQAVILQTSDPLRAQAIAQTIGIDTSTPAGLAQLNAMSNSSPKGQAEQKQANENAQTANEILNRNLNTKVAQTNSLTSAYQAATARGELDVNKAKLGIEQQNQGVTLMKGATGTAQTANSANQTIDDISTLQGVLGNGKISQSKGAYYVAAQGLPPSIINNAIAAGAKMNSDGTLDVSNLLSRVQANVGELKNQALAMGGNASAGASDSRLNVITTSAGGKGLDVSLPSSVISDSLKAVRTFASQMANQSTQMNSSYNQQLQQTGGNFTPVTPTYRRQTAPQVGDIVGGKAYLGGPVNAPTSWSK